MPYNPDSEDALELATMELFESLGWQTVRAFEEAFSPEAATATKPYLGRASQSEVVLREPLQQALVKLNPDLPLEALDQAIDELTRSRAAMSLARANREIYHLLKNGVKVPYRDEKNEPQLATVRLIDWQRPDHNDFLLVSQLWITGDIYTRRADLVGFVNGLPLLFIELKASHVNAKQAYDHNFTDYKDTISPIFWYNGLVILSNGDEARVGSVTAPWEHFAEWKRINDEGEAGVIDLETTLRATCPPARLLDLLENFTLFAESEGGLNKLVGKNHQYLGVNNAVGAVEHITANQGRLGVFWHTQGSGKSYSMIFFAQKVLRKLPGNWTFVVITDRKELDGQIYKTFARAGVVTEPEKRVRAQSGEHLEQLLTEDHRYVFTLIHKFNQTPEQPYSRREDIVVMVDEAHRTQYDILALNMRLALPQAAFIAFTGTPLIAGEERTKEVFGDYVSIYNFKQSMDDQATVPLYYENRIPELQIINDRFNPDIERVLEAAALSDEEEARLEQLFQNEYHLITRRGRLKRVARDIVEHFIGREYRGKAMVVSIDKLTAVKMYDLVQHYWQQKLAQLRAQLATCDPIEQPELEGQIAFMAETDMAVVVSQEQNEIQKFREKGLDIAPHRRRMVNEDLEEKFKDPEDPFRLVFVCAMWMTGFDVPTCSTIYLDKPMRNHTLMQTIARANRVFGQKNNGLIVDYIGVFRNLQEALAIYAGDRAGEGEDDTPVKDKQALRDQLGQAIDQAVTFCADQGVDIGQIAAEKNIFQRTRLKAQAEDALLVNDAVKQEFLGLAATVTKLYKAILPDKAAGQYQPEAAVLGYIAAKIKSRHPEVDLPAVVAEVEAVLDESITPRDYIIRDMSEPVVESRAPYEAGTPYLVDLSQLNFEALAAHFKTGHQRTEVEKLRGAISHKLKQMIRLNRQRMDYQQHFQQLIDAYNSGSRNVEEMFNELLALVKVLNEEEQRHLAEGLTEEELALFDLLVNKPEVKLTQKERQAVKKAVRELLAKLKDSLLTLDWRKRQQTQAQIRITIEDVLDKLLPEVYTADLFEAKCELVYQHVYENYYGEERSTYSSMPLAV